MTKPILAIDFDGVLHAYTSGWTSSTEIPDPPVPGAQEFCTQALAYFDLVIVSSRSTYPFGTNAMLNWLKENNFPDGIRIADDGKKPPAFLSIDDRAQTFTGKFPDDPKKLLAFRPWFRAGSKVNQRSTLWTRVNSLYDAAMEAQLEGDPFDTGSLLSTLKDILRETE